MHILRRSTVYSAEGRPPAERIAFFTSLCRLRSGTVLAGFQLGRAKHAADATARLCRSRNEGADWHELPYRFETRIDGEPGSLSGAEMIEVEPGRLLLFSTWFDRSIPDRPLFNPATEGILRSRLLCCESNDEGDTWTAWRELPTGALRGCAMTGSPVAWGEGLLAFAFESFKEYDDPGPGPHGSWVIVSRDGGRTFGPPWRVAQDPRGAVYYWDQRLAATDRAGEFVSLFWTHDRAGKRDLEVHRLRTSLLEHPDGAPRLPEPTNIPGQIAAPLWLGGERWLAFVVDRERPANMTLWSTDDDGRTWPAGRALRVYEHDERAVLSQGRENVDYAQFWEDMGKWSFGHPAIARLDERRALVAWYAGTPDAMSIHSAQIALDS